MAYIEPKTNWTARSIPVASDFNRIEGNAKANHDAVIVEQEARAADVDAEASARMAAISAEASARAIADAMKTPMLTLAAGLGQIGYWSADDHCTLPAGGTWFFYVTRFTPSSNRQYGEAGIAAGGTNHAEYTDSSGFYIRIA